MGRNDDDDSVAKMKAAEEALEAKQKVRTTCEFVFLVLNVKHLGGIHYFVQLVKIVLQPI